MNRTATAHAQAVRIERIEPPTFRTVRLASIHGISFKPGEQTDGRNEWPNLGAFEPVNETARTIASYAQRFGHSRCFPSRPWSEAFNCLYLPAQLPDGFVVHEASGPRDNHPTYEDPPGAPHYIANHSVHFAGRVTIPAGRPFAWLRWPLKGWRAANEPAAQVVRYGAEYGGEHPHPDLKHVVGPFCELRGLFLPELRPLNEKPARSSPPIITSHGMLEENGAIA
jgi:hypothetical protein